MSYDTAPPSAAIAVIFFMAAALNLVAAWRWPSRTVGIIWLFAAGGFGALGATALMGRPVGLPEGVKNAIDAAASPLVVSAIACLGFVGTIFGRRFLVRPAVGWSILIAAILGLGLSLEDADFAAVVGAADHLPIVGLVFALGFFLWLGTAQAEENDRRRRNGQPMIEEEHQERVMVWPELVYIELIAAIFVVTLLIVWSLAVRAPLEAPANPAVTPNPSKAPWYFVGLQEMLSGIDVWWGGAILPLLVIIALAALPYVDRGKEGNGYYSIRGRRLAWTLFLGGFLSLGIMPILVGTFMRGPNWDFYGPFEPRDPRPVIHQTTDNVPRAPPRHP